MLILQTVEVITRHYCIIYDNLRTVTYNFMTVVGIPSLLLVLIYGHIFLTIWHKQLRQVQSLPPAIAVANANGNGNVTGTGNDSARRRRKRAIKTAQILMLIAILFLICWLPTLALWYDYMYRPFMFFFSPSFAMFQACSVMIFAHSCVNPIIYFTSNASYRRSLKAMLSCGFRCRIEKVLKDASAENESKTQSTAASFRLGKVTRTVAWHQ